MCLHVISVPANQLVSAGGATSAPRATEAHSLRLARVTDLAPWDREAQLICWALEVILRTQSRQQLKREILLSQRAHEMRSNSTPSESALWAALSHKQLGVAFRWQVVICNRYVADFLAPSLKLIVEVDGGYHRQRVTADARRTRVLERLGYRVVRVDAEFVLRQLAAAVEVVREEVQACASRHAL